MPGNERKIVEYAKKLGMEPGRLSYIILTHPDIDHSGSAAKLKGLTGAKVAIHEADAPRLSGEKPAWLSRYFQVSAMREINCKNIDTTCYGVQG